jgi:hypothetical protein
VALETGIGMQGRLFGLFHGFRSEKPVTGMQTGGMQLR